MIKAIFLDYNGTLVEDGGVELYTFAKRVVENSLFTSVDEFVVKWYTLWRSVEKTCYKETYKTADEILLYCLDILINEYNLVENIDELIELVHGFWSNAPLFNDVVEFFDYKKIPVYILTNNSSKYVEVCMKNRKLNPDGIISSDSVIAYKPHEEVFNLALNISGCKPNEVIHIGDSINSDYYGALNLGINAYLIKRNPNLKIDDNIKCITNLNEIYNIIEELNKK